MFFRHHVKKELDQLSPDFKKRFGFDIYNYKKFRPHGLVLSADYDGVNEHKRLVHIGADWNCNGILLSWNDVAEWVRTSNKILVSMRVIFVSSSFMILMIFVFGCIDLYLLIWAAPALALIWVLTLGLADVLQRACFRKFLSGKQSVRLSDEDAVVIRYLEQAIGGSKAAPIPTKMAAKIPAARVTPAPSSPPGKARNKWRDSFLASAHENAPALIGLAIFWVLVALGSNADSASLVSNLLSKALEILR